MKLQTQWGETGELTPIPAAQAPEGVEGAYILNATGDIVMPGNFEDGSTSGFSRWNGDGDGRWEGFNMPDTPDWQQWNANVREWSQRPDVQAIFRQQGAGKNFMQRFAPAIISGGFGVGSGVALAGGFGNYLSNIGNSIANLPSTISNAVSGGIESLSSLFPGADATTSLSDFLAADAAQLAQQGITGAQLETALIQAGADALTAADIAQLVGQGITDQAQLKSLIDQSTSAAPSMTTPGAPDASKAASTTAKTAGGAQAIKNILSNGGSVDDWITLAGSAGPALLSMYASGKQSEALEEVARLENERYERNYALGAPSRARYEASFADGFDITQDPALKAAMEGTSTTMLNRLSTQGNPFGNPSGVAEANKYVLSNVALPYLNQYRTLNANTGGYSAYNNSAASGPNMQPTLSAINADTNVWSAAGAGVADIFTPKTDFEQLWKKYGPQTGFSSSNTKSLA